MIDTTTFSQDIPLSLAISAHNGISFTPEKRGEARVKEYAITLETDYNALFSQASEGGTLELLDAEFARYREGYAKRYRAFLNSKSRIVSWMIAGPSNFPSGRMQKRNEIADRRLNEVFEFRTRALKAINKVLRPDLAPIMSGDSDAVVRLEDELRQAEERQAQMKAINAAHKNFLKNPASLDKSGLSESAKDIVRFYVPAYSWEQHPMAPYQLTNNSANIRRMKDRLEHLKRAKATPDKTIEAANGLTIEDSPADNRVRLFFPGKPDADVRSELKSNGFRWAPTLGCWQAYRNNRSIELARKMMK